MKRSQYWIFIPLLGILAMVCRVLLFTLGLDSRNLLVPGSLPEVLLAGLCLLALLCALLAQTPGGRGNRKLSGLTNLLLAAAMLLFREDRGSVAVLLWGLFRLGVYASAGALCLLALCRFRGQTPPFGLNAIVCIGLLVRLVACYQTWSHIPQMQNYVFALFGALSLTGFAYQQTARELSLGSPRWRLLFGLLGCFFCLAAAVPSQPFYFLAGLWMLGCILFDPKEDPQAEKSTHSPNGNDFQKSV